MDTIIIDGLSFALPLFIMAIGGIYSEKSGITNLAIEGLQGFGAFVGALTVVLFSKFANLEVQSLFYVALIFSMLGGMVYSMLHALLCINFKANQVISGVVINILAAALTVFLTTQVNSLMFGAVSDKFQLGVSNRFTIPVISRIPVIGAMFKSIYPFEIVIVVIAFIAWYVLYKTKYGLRLRACGDNPHSVDAAGVEVSKIRFKAVMVSGALSGLGGMCFAYSISANFSPSIYMGYGYLAIAALIFGNWKILPTLGACLLFGFAKSGGYKLGQVLELPSTFSDLIMILPYVLTLLLLIFFSKSNRSPRALGEIYDKGKR
ncbi:MAG: ABC transporter permease [Anaerocolumna aminovalerica]|uniref:ABC transporter permease n=1 Tax=Anaerocolumna aminovalerica TaxID=1527 RepID=UPI001C0F12CC|nr:ABC transporter permease [Anaerocolumna aminovalerica]MBU5330579.1 ABC transporter permease [Anaerocolumna aminovalerica]MDU6264518.1 ABC transporter permease [Anaerocolumna aminovalerica]